MDAYDTFGAAAESGALKVVLDAHAQSIAAPRKREVVSESV